MVTSRRKDSRLDSRGGCTQFCEEGSQEKEGVGRRKAGPPGGQKGEETVKGRGQMAVERQSPVGTGHLVVVWRFAPKPLMFPDFFFFFPLAGREGLGLSRVLLGG